MPWCHFKLSTKQLTWQPTNERLLQAVLRIMCIWRSSKSSNVDPHSWQCHLSGLWRTDIFFAPPVCTETLSVSMFDILADFCNTDGVEKSTRRVSGCLSWDCLSVYFVAANLECSISTTVVVYSIFTFPCTVSANFCASDKLKKTRLQALPNITDIIRRDLSR